MTIDDARAIATTLPRSYEALVRDRVKFRVAQIVYAAFSQDKTIMGFGFPREERDALVASEPDKFVMPSPSDMRYRWVQVAHVRAEPSERRLRPTPRRGVEHFGHAIVSVGDVAVERNGHDCDNLRHCDVPFEE